MSNKVAHTKHRRVWPFVCIVLVVCICCCYWYCCRCRPCETTLIVVRHAEKTGDGLASPLSSAGATRAEHLAQVLGEMGVDVIYATQYLRTKQTAQPLADALNLSITEYQYDDIQWLAGDIRSYHRGKTILVVGHSNTVPQIVEEFSAASCGSITDEEYDNLYVVVWCRFCDDRLLHLKYG